MSSRKLGSIACMLVAFAGLDVAAQRAASIPPDITGAYERYGNIFGPRTEAQQKDPTIPPPNPPPPLKPEYLKQWQARVQAAREAEAKGQPLATGYTHCLPDGMPSMMAAMFPIEFLQSKGQVTVIEEAFTQIRRILLDRPQKAIDDVEPGFYGHSVGHWEGDTPHSKQLRIKERIRLVAPNILWNEITMEDPVTLEKPWTVRYAYRRMPDYTLLEYICEDNREYADEQGLQKIRIER